MSGVEVIGLLASASQLVSYSFKLISSIDEVCRQFQDAPRRIQQHAEHIKRLADIAAFIQPQIIEQYPPSKIIHINTQIEATIKQAKTLSELLDQVTYEYAHGSFRKYWRILKGKREKEILSKLDQLEKEKTSLQLCMSVVHTFQRGNTKGGITKSLMPEKQGCQREQPMDTDTTGRNWAQPKISEEFKSDSLSSEASGRALVKKDRSLSDTSVKEPTNGNAGKSQDNAVNTSSGHHHHYETVGSDTSARQLNGDALFNRGSESLPKHHYKDVNARGYSRQINGNVSDVETFRLFFS